MQNRKKSSSKLSSGATATAIGALMIILLLVSAPVIRNFNVETIQTAYASENNDAEASNSNVTSSNTEESPDKSSDSGTATQDSSSQDSTTKEDESTANQNNNEDQSSDFVFKITDLKTANHEYEAGEDVKITGTVKEVDQNDDQVKITVSNPDDGKVIDDKSIDINTNKDDSDYKSFEYKLELENDAPSGDYKVVAVYGDDKQDTTFTVIAPTHDSVQQQQTSEEDNTSVDNSSNDNSSDSSESSNDSTSTISKNESAITNDDGSTDNSDTTTSQLSDTQTYDPKIWTDKDDYSPGQTATIFGSGFLADQEITLTITHPDFGIVTWTAHTDGDGKFTTVYQLDTFAETYTVTATDGTNSATTTFRDSAFIGSAILAPSSVSVNKGSSASYTVTVTRGTSTGAFSAALRFISTGTDTISSSAVSFSPDPISFASGDTSKTSTVTIATSALAAGGNYAFKIEASAVATGATNGDKKQTSQAALVINNNAPVAAGQSVTTNEDTTKTITLTGSDANGDSLTFSIVSGPSHGSLGTISSASATSATVTYTPTSNYNGEDSFTFKANDGTADSSPATVSITVNSVNDAPLANAGADQTVDEGSVVTLDGSASSDPDSDTLSYSWTQTAGTNVTLSGASTASPSFTAPSVAVDETLTFSLTVGDGHSGTDSDFVDLVVKNQNQRPTANAGPDQSVDEGSLVTLDGSASSDEDGTIASYSWSQTDGASVTLNGSDTASPTFIAPAVNSDTDLTFALTVTDSDGANASDTIKVTVTSVNQLPTANAGTDQTVDEGSTVTLDGSGSFDPDSNITSYSWSQTAGTAVTLSDGTSATPTFTAPSVNSTGETLAFELIVTDNDGANATDSVEIVVKNVNQLPIADAGTDQNVNESATVTLDGSASSDPDGGTLSYSWAQVNGSTPITLSDSTIASPTFTAPNVGPDGETLTFELTVSDGDGANATDSVSINIQNVNQNPVANAGSNQTVDEGSVVTLDGSASSDPDGGATTLAYSWTQTAGTSVTLSDSTTTSPAFNAPAVGSAGETLTFELTVSDGQGGTDTDTTDVFVQNINKLPTADAGSDFSVNETDTSVQLVGTGSSDSDGTIASYNWEQVVSGSEPTVALTNSDTDTATFDAPAVTSDTGLTFRLTVTDSDGGTANDTVVVTVKNVNQPPVAVLLIDPTSIDEDGGVSNLVASTSSDSDGSISTFTFEQVAGTNGTITVDGTDTSKATFTAPAVDGNETVTIKLTVTDNDGATNSTTADIQVNNVLHETTLTLNAITSVPWNTDVTVTGKLVDSDTGNAGIAGKTISFDGTGAANLEDTTTGADGTFSTTGRAPASVATSFTVKAHFDGDTSGYKASESSTMTYSTKKHTVSIIATLGSTTKPWGQPTAFTATLLDTSAGGIALQGKTIHFDGTGVIGVADQPTDSNGKAVGSGTAPTTVATGWTYQVHFAGDSLYSKKDSTIKTYSTIKHKTSLTLSLSPNPVSAGATYKVGGTLKDFITGTPLGSQTITITATAPITISDKTTSSTGGYSSRQPAPTTAGSYSLQSHFAGNGLYEFRDSKVVTLTVQ